MERFGVSDIRPYEDQIWFFSVTEDKRRKDKFLNNGKKKFFLTFRFETQFKISPPNFISRNKIICFKANETWNNKHNENEKKSTLEQSLQLLRPKER